jgi:hypothetical protein
MSDSPSLEARQARLAKTQALFRAVNEQVGILSEKHGIADGIGYVCECAIPECAGTIELARGEYEAIRQDPKRFLVLPGHVFPEVERVVDERGRYVVVEKFGAGAAVAESTNGRTPAH